MNLHELKYQTLMMASPATCASATLPAPTGFTTAPTTPTTREPPEESRPPSSTVSNQIFGTGLNFDRDDNTPRQLTCFKGFPPPGGDCHEMTAHGWTQLESVVLGIEQGTVR